MENQNTTPASDNQNPSSQTPPVIPNSMRDPEPLNIQSPKLKGKIPKPALIGGIIFVIFAILAGVAFAFKDQIPGLGQKPTPTPATQAISLSPTTDPTAGWVTYNSESFNDTFPVFEIKYPSSWTPDEISQGTPLILSFITNKNSSESAQVKAPIQIQVQIGENPECPCEKVTIGNLQANKIPNDSWEIIGFVSNGYSYEFMRSLKPIINQDISITEDESKRIFDQILSTFKFTEVTDLDVTEWRLRETFKNSKGQTKYVLDGSVLDPLDYRVYLGDRSDGSGNNVFITRFSPRGSGSISVSNNTGIKYIVIITPNRPTPFIVSDENGKLIDIDTSKLYTGIKFDPPGVSPGIDFVQWNGNSTSFTIEIVGNDIYEATFDAATGKQIGETKPAG